MKKLLTQRQAWLLLAKAWRQAKEEPPGRWSADVGYGVSYGLCPLINDLFNENRISEATFRSMDKKVPRRKREVYAWPLTRAGARARAAFCRRQAAKLVKKKVKHG